MDPNQLTSYASNPAHWKKKALSLRASADGVWNLFLDGVKSSIDKESKTIDPDSLEHASNILTNSQFLYALAAECALKGIIIKNDPSSILFTTKVDGTGKVLSAEILRKGNKGFDTHNLEKLANESGVFEDYESNEWKEILSYATDVIRWRGRYPTPLSSDSTFKVRGTIPSSMFGHYFRDVFDPCLDQILKKYES